MDGKERNTKVESNTHSLQGKYIFLHIAPFSCLCLFLITLMYPVPASTSAERAVSGSFSSSSSFSTIIGSITTCHTAGGGKRGRQIYLFFCLFFATGIYMYIIQHACQLIY